MPEHITDDFDQLIHGAATRGKQFLGIVQKRCADERINVGGKVLELRPVRGPRSKDRMVLQTHLELGPLARRPSLIVYADDVGSSLHVGWQLVRTVDGALALVNPLTAMKESVRNSADTNPESLRRLKQTMYSFHATVFLPVVEQLVDHLQRSSAAGGGGGFVDG